MQSSGRYTRTGSQRRRPAAAPGLCHIDLHDAALVQLLAVRRHPAVGQAGRRVSTGERLAGERWRRSNYGGGCGGGGGRAPCLATHHTAARAVFLPSRSWLQNMVALPPGFQAPPRCSARQEGRAGAGWALHKLQVPLPSRLQEQGGGQAACS